MDPHRVIRIVSLEMGLLLAESQLFLHAQGDIMDRSRYFISPSLKSDVNVDAFDYVFMKNLWGLHFRRIHYLQRCLQLQCISIQCFNNFIIFSFSYLLDCICILGLFSRLAQSYLRLGSKIVPQLINFSLK